MTIHQQVNLIAQKLPEVTTSQPFGEGCDVYKVMDKVFMLCFHLDHKAAVNLKVHPDHGIMLKDIYPYIRAGWHMNKKHWITVVDDESLDYSLIADLVLESYEQVIAKLKKVERLRIEAFKRL